MIRGQLVRRNGITSKEKFLKAMNSMKAMNGVYEDVYLDLKMEGIASNRIR